MLAIILSIQRCTKDLTSAISQEKKIKGKMYKKEEDTFKEDTILYTKKQKNLHVDSTQLLYMHSFSKVTW